jgi:Ni/Co efflux regulator RcnB
MSMKKLVLGLLMASISLSAVPATAQPYGNWSDRQREEDARANQDQNRGNWNGDRRYEQARDERRDNRRDNRGWHRGWGQDRGVNYRWSRGQQMGYNDWNSSRRVDYRDYRRYNLRQPPRGYEWRRNDDRFVLGAIATGVVLSVILNSGR